MIIYNIIKKTKNSSVMETKMQAKSDYEQETLVMPKAPRIRPMDHPLDN